MCYTFWIVNLVADTTPLTKCKSSSENCGLSDNFVLTCFPFSYTELTNEKALWHLDGFFQYICREVL